MKHQHFPFKIISVEPPEVATKPEPQILPQSASSLKSASTKGQKRRSVVDTKTTPKCKLLDVYFTPPSSKVPKIDAKISPDAKENLKNNTKPVSDAHLEPKAADVICLDD